MFTKEYEQEKLRALESEAAEIDKLVEDCIEGKTLREEFEQADMHGSTGRVYSKKLKIAKLHKEQPTTRCKECIIKGDCILEEATQREAKIW